MVAWGLRPLGVLLALILITVAPAVVVAADADSSAENWRIVDVTLNPETPIVGEVAVLSFSVLDQDDAELTDLRIGAVLRAPSNAYNAEPPTPVLTTTGRYVDPDVASERGRYEVAIALNQAGRWWIEIEARDDLIGVIRHSYFLKVDAGAENVVQAVENPVFLQGDAWGSYYRLDPATGSIVGVDGHQILQAADRPWIADTRVEPVEPPSALYGGVWRLGVELSNGLTGSPISLIDAGEVRASVYVGSVDEPAIATSLAISPDGSRVYFYWTRQLGQGWLSTIAIASTETGEILEQRVLQGAIAADGAVGRIDVSPDGSQLFISEQVFRSAGISGYRLTTLDTNTLETISEHRRTVSPDDPLTHCLIAYPGPTGVVGEDPSHHYSLCSPEGDSGRLSLLVWNHLTGEIVHQMDLDTIAGDSSQHVDGVASPDGRHFYVVNTLTRRVAEVDMLAGTELRRASFQTQPEEVNPSPWDRLVDWILGAVSSSAAASVLIDPGVSISPDGSSLYFVAPTSTLGQGFGDGVWVVDTDSLTVREHMLSGQPVSGIVVTRDGHVAVIRPASGERAEEITIIDPEGRTLVSLAIPEHTKMMSALP